MHAANERRRSEAMVCGQLRHGVRSPRPLPRPRLPHLPILLTLVLPGLLLIVIIGNVEIGMAEPAHHVECAGWRDVPSELGRPVQRSTVVMQIVGMNGIEKSIRRLA